MSRYRKSQGIGKSQVRPLLPIQNSRAHPALVAEVKQYLSNSKRHEIAELSKQAWRYTNPV
jgi:hypothetical protein